MNDDGIGAGLAPPQDNTWDGELTFGGFLFDVASRTLTWTGEIFRIYGFEPSEVVLTLELLSAHQPPQDRNDRTPGSNGSSPSAGPSAGITGSSMLARSRGR